MSSDSTLKEISFFTRFTADIQSHKKTITIRDQSESDFSTGDIVRSVTNPEGNWIADLEITQVYTVTLDRLNEQHAIQENMSLESLKTVIKKIYPDDDQFFVIEYKVIKQP